MNKRFVTVFVSMMLIYGFAACGAQTDNDTDTGSSSAAVPQVNIVTEAGTLPLTEADAAALAEVLGKGEWIRYTADCACDYQLSVSGEVLSYHSSCGTFNDHGNDRSLHTGDDTQQQVNTILAKYATPEKEG